MALIKCPECGKEISDQSKTCIYCGFPLMDSTSQNYNEENLSQLISNADSHRKVDNWNIAFALYKKAGELGDSYSQNWVGNCYKRGTGVEKDLDKAIYWYQKSANQNNSDAINNLAALYEDGIGVPQNTEKAIELYTLASELGNCVASGNLGTLYDLNYNSSDHYSLAVKYYNLAIQQGATSSAVLNNLAVCYADGKVVPVDRQKAISLYEKAISLGSTKASENLQILNENILQTNAKKWDSSGDYAKAFQAYLQLANAGDVNAQLKVANYYEKGQGTTKNYALARQWYERAVDAGNSTAMNNLAVMYMNGVGVEVDNDKARSLLKKAISCGAKGSTTTFSNNLYELDKRISDSAKATVQYNRYSIAILCVLILAALCFITALQRGLFLAGIISAAFFGVIAYLIYHFMPAAAKKVGNDLYARKEQEKMQWHANLTCTCPRCGKHTGHPIGDFEKKSSIAFWGFASDKLGKTYKCSSCGYMW